MDLNQPIVVVSRFGENFPLCKILMSLMNFWSANFVIVENVNLLKQICIQLGETFIFNCVFLQLKTHYCCCSFYSSNS